MKYLYAFILAVAITCGATAQKKEKIKGTKTVTVSQKEIAAFEKVEVEDNIDLYLVKGPKEAMEIEADDNLHDVIQAEINGSTLRIFTSKEVMGFKKLIVKLTYTDKLSGVVARHEAIVNALSDLDTPVIAVKTLDYSRAFLNVKSPQFSLSLNDKSKAEINARCETVTIDMSKNATMKALIAGHQVKIDMYQKATAEVEGDAAIASVRLDNNAVYKGSRFTARNLDYTAEGYSTGSVTATEMLSLNVKGKSETEFYGNAKIEVKSFNDNALILKKELKP